MTSDSDTHVTLQYHVTVTMPRVTHRTWHMTFLFLLFQKKKN